MTTVLLLATLDTKGEECRYVRERLLASGCDVITMDVGVRGEPMVSADVSRARVAAAGGASLARLQAEEDQGTALDFMGRGAAVVLNELHSSGAFAGVLALGGSCGASLGARAMAGLPLGFPKLIVTTVAAGDTRPYLHGGDVAMLYPVVDLAGINSISARVLDNAAAAVAGMARATPATPAAYGGPRVGMTMFGITTPCVDRIRALLLERGYEPLVFSANGVGGASMERLIADGSIAGVVDVTTTELADRLVGGILPAEEHRLEGAGARGLPQVVAPGALDVVNFGPAATVPAHLLGRRLHRHNAEVTLMRTSTEECAELGRILAAKLNAATGRRCLVVPLRGLSALSAPGGPFEDPLADGALFDAVRAGLSDEVELLEIDCHINESAMAAAMADRFHEYMLSEKE